MLQLQWTTFAAALVAALIVGWIVSRLFQSQIGKDKPSLRRQLDDLKQQHQSYQINVTEHFSRTTDLIEELNANYNRIQSHLQQGADDFIKPEYRLESARTGDASLEDLAPNTATNDTHAGPRDYAPKTPNQEGMLSETYGFKVADLEADAIADKKES